MAKISEYYNADGSFIGLTNKRLRTAILQNN